MCVVGRLFVLMKFVIISLFGVSVLCKWISVFGRLLIVLSVLRLVMKLNGLLG